MGDVEFNDDQVLKSMILKDVNLYFFTNWNFLKKKKKMHKIYIFSRVTFQVMFLYVIMIGSLADQFWMGGTQWLGIQTNV